MKVGFQSDRKQPLGIFAILPVVVYLKGVNQLRSILVQWFWWSVYVDFKIDKDMKDIIHNWKFWVAVAAVVLAIVAVVLYFVSPKFCYAASGLLIGAFAGFISGYFVCKNYGIEWSRLN